MVIFHFLIVLFQSKVDLVGGVGRRTVVCLVLTANKPEEKEVLFVFI